MVAKSNSFKLSSQKARSKDLAIIMGKNRPAAFGDGDRFSTTRSKH